MGEGMSVIGDNIANANTNGFKASRAEFQDVLATSLKGMDGGDQFGSGTKLAHVTPSFAQGNITRTESVSDLAISGNGFFVVDAPFGKGFSRDGSFHFDKEGNMINSDDYRVQGYQADEKGMITNKLGDIKLGGIAIPATSTKNVGVYMNLDSTSKVLEFDAKNPEKTSNYNNSITVFDNVGTERLVTLYFNKTADNQWRYRAAVDGKDAAGGKEGEMKVMAEGDLKFNSKGVLEEEVKRSSSFNFNNGASPDQAIEFDFGKSVKEGGSGLDASTQYGVKTSISRHTQDGSSAAQMASMSFNDKGILTAIYNNGQARDIAQIAIAKFENNEALFKKGKNLFKESRKSGQGALGKPGEGGRGDVLAKSLELSTVDIASEFVNLMTAQRNFVANTKTVSTADEMLQSVLSIKR